MRTPHGTADVAIDLAVGGVDPGVTLRDLVSAVTGQAAPNAVLVDGRTVDTSRPLRQSGLLFGSIVDTDLAHAPRVDDSSATFLQITGPGAGTLRSLDLGRYRVGPGRRVQAAELELADVEAPVFDIEVSRSGNTVIPLSPIVLDGQQITEPTRWTDEVLASGGRTFALERTAVSDHLDRPDPSVRADSEGRVLYNRPPGAVSDRRFLVVDALRDAVHHRPGLWHERLAGGQPLVVSVGAIPRSGTRATIDLRTDRVVAVSGNAATTTAYARSLVVDAVTAHGPSDLELVVAATPADLGAWDWAKWLPHTRVGRAAGVEGSAALITNELELTDFAAEFAAESGGERAAGRSHQTLLVITDDRLWATPDAPLRRLVLDGPPEVAIVVLTTSPAGAPASCQSLVDFRSGAAPGTAQLVRIARGGARLDLVVPLPDERTALTVARHLAPLRDPDLPPPQPPAPHIAAPQTIAEFAGYHRVNDASREVTVRWDTGVGTLDRPATMPIGVLDDRPITVDLGSSRGVVVSGSSVREAVALVRTLTLSLACAWSPDELAIITVDHRATAGDDPVRHLPHAAGTFDDRGSAAARRFTDRLWNEMLGDSPSERRLAVVVTQPAESELAAPGILTGLALLADAAPGVHLVLATELPLASLAPDLREVCSIEVTVDRVGGRSRAMLHDRIDGRRTPFEPFGPPRSSASIAVRPYVFGRPTTALERRLDRQEPADGAHGGDRAVERLVHDLRQLASQRGCDPVPALIPRLLPDEVDTFALFAEHPDDGIPLGLIEQVGGDEPEPYRWAPGRDATRVVIGSARSGIRTVLDTILFGAVSRYRPDELRLYVIDHSDNRRAAIARFAHTDATATPNIAEHVATMLGSLTDELHSRAASDADRPTILLVVRDLERLAADALAAISTLAGDGAPFGIHVVATASRWSDLADLIDRFDHVVVGGLTDPGEYEHLDVREPAALVGHAGRCITVPAQRLVQFAASPSSLEASLRRLDPDAPTGAATGPTEETS